MRFARLVPDAAGRAHREMDSRGENQGEYGAGLYTAKANTGRHVFSRVAVARSVPVDTGHCIAGR
eukprot:1799158-Rhodomonas_salina.1